MGNQCKACKETEQSHEFYSEAFQTQVIIKEHTLEDSHPHQSKTSTLSLSATIQEMQPSVIRVQQQDDTSHLQVNFNPPSVRYFSERENLETRRQQ
jgi:hypothetical protein